MKDIEIKEMQTQGGQRPASTVTLLSSLETDRCSTPIVIFRKNKLNKKQLKLKLTESVKTR